jgi:predicted RNase H-like HicB family nuclease
LTELAQLQSSQIATLREAFETLRDAQESYLKATEQVHQRVIALAQPGVIDAH